VSAPEPRPFTPGWVDPGPLDGAVTPVKAYITPAGPVGKADPHGPEIVSPGLPGVDDPFNRDQLSARDLAATKPKAAHSDDDDAGVHVPDPPLPTGTTLTGPQPVGDGPEAARGENIGADPAPAGQGGTATPTETRPAKPPRAARPGK